jgi:hypothetical protein
MEIRSFTSTTLRRAPVVGVPTVKVANTLVSWLRWMAGSYVGRLETKTTSLRSACRKYLGLTIPRVCLWPYQPSWAPRMRDLLRSVCYHSPASLLWTPRILRWNAGLSVGCKPEALPRTSGCLGAIDLRPSLGRHASSGPARLLQLCRISGCLYTPYVQD